MIQTAIQIVAIFGMIGIGVAAGKRHWFPDDFSVHLSKLLLSVLYPALLFSAILRRYTLSSLAANWQLPVGAACILLTGWAVGWLAKRTLVRHYRAPTRRAFHFICTMNNYSFLPIMLIAGAPLGETGVAMVALSTLGSDTLMWTLGFRTFTGQRIRLRTLPKVLTRPTLLALLSAVALLAVLQCFGVGTDDLMRWPLTKTVLDTLYVYVGGGTIVTSSVVCGMCLARISPKGLLAPLQLLTAAFRMVIIPAVLLTVLILLPIDPAQRYVFSVIALMPGAMVGISLAEVYGGDTPFLSGSLLLTHLLCIFTVPLGLWVVSFFA